MVIIDNMHDISFGVPFTKINPDKRTVTGIATADNIDKIRDIVEAGATLDAFASWGGNVREMHMKKAVGKALSVRPVKVPHNNFHSGSLELSQQVRVVFEFLKAFVLCRLYCPFNVLLKRRSNLAYYRVHVRRWRADTF